MKKYLIILLAAFAFVFSSCSHQTPAVTSAESPVSQNISSETSTQSADNSIDQTAVEATLPKDCTFPPITLFESWPKETSLDNDYIQDAFPTWLEAINLAQETLDFSEYYAVTAPDSTMESIVAALEAATARGVKIRFILEQGMMNGDNLPMVERLRAIPGLELRAINYNAMTGGVQHSKYFIVDGKFAIYGSQNFDWRSLEHISEMGVRLTPVELVAPLKATFEIDWALAENNIYKEPDHTTFNMPVAADYKGEKHLFESALSPKGLLPDESLWDLPKIIQKIDEAKNHIYIQLLDYSTITYDKKEFFELDDALKRAAARGVEIRLLVSDWSKRAKLIADLKRLQQIENITTKMMVIPEHSAGFIPYARVIHSKFMVVDDDSTWIGTSNWGGDYFYKSRNVGLIVKGKTFNADLTRSFLHYWDSEYAEQTDPNVEYEVRKRY